MTEVRTYVTARSSLAHFLMLLLGTGAMFLAEATLVPALDLDKLTDDASLIVLGEVSGVKEIGEEYLQLSGGSVKAHIEEGEIRPDRILKGDAKSTLLNFQYYETSTFVGFRSVAGQQYGVYFFRPGRGGRLEFVSPYYPSVPSVRGAVPVGATPIDRVVSALGAVLRSEGSRPDEKAWVVFVLSRSRSSSSLAVLRGAVAPDNPTAVRLAAAGALLERDDLTGLSLVVGALSDGVPDTSTPLTHNLVYAVSEGIRDARAIPALKKLIVSVSPEVRRAAASALMHTQSPEATDALLKALGDTDFKARYYSAVGLAEITEQMDWRPNEEVFRADEARYVKHWREWAGGRK